MALTIPAVRIAVSDTLKSRYRMSETTIAGRLEVAQAAVSKYLNGKYSRRVDVLVKAIEARDLHLKVVEAIVKKRSNSYVAGLIDSVASEKALLEVALSLH